MRISPDFLCGRLGIDKEELAYALGLPSESVLQPKRIASPETRNRLRNIIAIIDQVRPWIASDMAAFALYRSQPLPSLGDLTAQELMHAGRGETLKHYLGRIAEGGFA